MPLLDHSHADFSLPSITDTSISHDDQEKIIYFSTNGNYDILLPSENYLAGDTITSTELSSFNELNNDSITDSIQPTSLQTSQRPQRLRQPLSYLHDFIWKDTTTSTPNSSAHATITHGIPFANYST